jgi:hypothetical protein
MAIGALTRGGIGVDETGGDMLIGEDRTMESAGGATSTISTRGPKM